MNPQVYLDNAATTFPKPEVVYATADELYRNLGGNAGRGNNSLSTSATSIIRKAKSNLQELLHCQNKAIAFTASATDALNRIILGLGMSRGDVVYISPFEHNAVTRPLHHLERSAGIIVEVLPFDKTTLLPNLEAIEQLFTHQKPSAVITTHVSNVCGAVVPIEKIFSLAKQKSATTIVDMSQSAGLVDISLSSELIDFAVFAGHKTLYAPFGVGGFVCHPDASLNPVLFGGNGINSIEQDMPNNIIQMTEIGSQNIYAIAGLMASTNWLLETGIEAIWAKETRFRDMLLENLRNNSEIRIVGDGMQCDRASVVSFVHSAFAPDEVEMLLAKRGIATRAGVQCSPLAHDFFNTLTAGAIRLSASYLNVDSDIEVICDALQELKV